MATARSLLQEGLTAATEAAQRRSVGNLQSRLTASLRQGSANRNAREELLSILQGQNSAQPASCFGVSPPLRTSGAAPPFARDAADAAAATQRSLQALRELETASTCGLTFSREEPSCCRPVHPIATRPRPLLASGTSSMSSSTATSCNPSPIAPFTCRVEYFAV